MIWFHNEGCFAADIPLRGVREESLAAGERAISFRGILDQV